MDSNVDKLRKKAIKDQQKRIKPGECQKYVRLVVDASLTDLQLGQEFLPHLNLAHLNYEIRELPEAQCIIWERSVGQRTQNSQGILNEEWQIEEQVLRLVTTLELQRFVKNGTLESIGESLHAAFPGKQHTVVVMAKKKNKNCNATTNSLVQLQVLQQLAVLQVSDISELVSQLRRFTKAIAEAPYKQQKSETLGNFKKYLANDKKQCVRVVGTCGFGRLWQQHLNRLPQVTLEVAESIIAHYSCPKKLLDAFESTPSTDASTVLADLRINRGAPQPLQTDRRIGNVLSAKLHTLYTTRDPNALV